MLKLRVFLRCAMLGPRRILVQPPGARNARERDYGCRDHNDMLGESANSKRIESMDFRLSPNIHFGPTRDRSKRYTCGPRTARSLKVRNFWVVPEILPTVTHTTTKQQRTGAASPPTKIWQVFGEGLCSMQARPNMCMTLGARGGQKCVR